MGLITPEKVSEIKEQIVSYFNTCWVAPETFEVNNERVEEVLDNEGGAQSQQEMFMAMMMGGGAGQAFAEKIMSNKVFRFTPIQN